MAVFARTLSCSWRIPMALASTFAVCGATLFLGSAPVFAETSTATCNLYASTGGSDSNTGSSSSPLRTLKALIGHLQSNQTGCLVGGQTFNEGVVLHNGESHGVEGAPVTITSTSSGNPALINGRVVTETGADWLTFTHLRFTYSEPGLPSITIGSKHTAWTWDDVTAPTAICFNLVNSSYGLAEWTLIEHDRVHGCGSAEKFVCNQNTTFCETPPNDGFFIHGIYVGGGKQTTIRNNYIYENADRGVQMRAGAENITVEHNILDHNGEGAIFGDGATHATVQWNIITNSHSPCGEIAGCYDYGASEYNAIAPNLLANNDVYGNQCALSSPLCYPNQGNIETMAQVTIEHNLETNPQYTNLSEHNYTLQPASPVIGYGPDTAQPSETVTGTSGSEPTSTSGATTTESSGISGSTSGTTGSTSGTTTTTETTATTGGTTNTTGGTTKTKKGHGNKAAMASTQQYHGDRQAGRHRRGHHRKAHGQQASSAARHHHRNSKRAPWHA
jgi:parallel beta-helix repeat protein